MSIQADDSRKLEKLRAQYSLGGLTLETDDGRNWRRRMQESEDYFNGYSKNWEANRQLLCKFEAMIAEFGTYTAIAYPVINNFVSDIYFQNPDPLIQDKGGDRDLGKIVTDVAKSIHRENDSEFEIREGLRDQAWASFGVITVSFEQFPANAGQPLEEGSSDFVEPTAQYVKVQRLSPWKIRFDPKGRRWDLSDHRYIAFDTVEYLGPLLRSLENDDDRARLLAYYAAGTTAFTMATGESESGNIEYDPEFIPVTLRTIWSRPDKTVYKMPYGASFTFEPRPWDIEWSRANHGRGLFPVRYMPANRIPEDQKNTEGFIGIPYMELIAEHVKNVNKAQGLLVNDLGRTIDIYMTAKGAIDPQAKANVIDAGRVIKIIEVDAENLSKYPGQQVDKWDWKQFIYKLEPSAASDLKHMEFIDHELAMIERILPHDLQPAATATESLGEQQQLTRRMSVGRADAGKHYNFITKMIFLVIQARHTLPLRYQATTRFNQKVWQTFVEPGGPNGALKDIDLHFEYATGSDEPRTREQEFALRERVAQVLLPIYQAQQNWHMVSEVARDLVEMLNVIDADRRYFDDDVNQLVMQLLAVFRGLGKGQMGGQELTADNPAIVKAIPTLVTRLAQRLLTPAQLAEVDQMVQGSKGPGEPPAPPDGGGGATTGSLPAPDSPGEAAADAGARGSATAGMLGGLQSQQ